MIQPLKQQYLHTMKITNIWRFCGHFILGIFTAITVPGTAEQEHDEQEEQKEEQPKQEQEQKKGLDQEEQEEGQVEEQSEQKQEQE